MRSTDWRDLALVLVLALLWRGAILVWTDFAIESDEAVVGLMAKPLAELRELPVWYYGQPYMGALEAYAAAPFVWVLGATRVAVKLATLPFALGYVAAAWLLARRILGRRAALATGLYLALAPLVLSVWSLKLRGGYVLLRALCLVVLLRAHGVASRDPGRAAPRRAFLLGLVAGICVWLNLLALPFLAAAAGYLVARRAPLAGERRWAWLAAGLALGSAPLWLYNLAHGGATFAHLLGGGGEVEWGVSLARTLGTHLPMLLGALEPWTLPSEASPWRFGVVALVALGALALVARRRSGRERTPGASLYVGCALAYLACALGTRFGADPSPRYAVVLYTALAPLVGAVGARGGLGAAVLAAVLASNAYSVFSRAPEDVVAPAQWVRLGTVPPLAIDATLELLADEGVEAVATDYWTGPRIAFESGEAVVNVPTRYAPHAERFRRASRRAWVLRTEGTDARWMERMLDGLPEGLGLEWEERTADGMRFLLVGPEGLEPLAWTATATVGADVERVIDRNPRSFWETGPWQEPGQALQVDFGAPLAVGELGLLCGVETLPEALRVSVSPDGEAWRTVVDELRPTTHALRLPLDGGGAPPSRRLVRAVRLELVDGARRPWRVFEVYAFARAD